MSLAVSDLARSPALGTTWSIDKPAYVVLTTEDIMLRHKIIVGGRLVWFLSAVVLCSVVWTVAQCTSSSSPEEDRRLALLG